MRDEGIASGLQATNEAGLQLAQEVGTTILQACHILCWSEKLQWQPFGHASWNRKCWSSQDISIQINNSCFRTYLVALWGLCCANRCAWGLIWQAKASVLIVEYPPCNCNRFVLPILRPFVVLEILCLEAWMKNLWKVRQKQAMEIEKLTNRYPVDLRFVSQVIVLV